MAGMALAGTPGFASLKLECCAAMDGGLAKGPCDIYPKDEFGDSPRDHVLARLDSSSTEAADRERRARKGNRSRLPAGAEKARARAPKCSREAGPRAAAGDGSCEQAGDGKSGPTELPEGATTVMVRNIPSRYTAEELIADFHERGFEGGFDFFYLPIDFKNGRNRGYSFVNFRSAGLAADFAAAFNGHQLTRYPTQKILEVSPALTQGLDANVIHYTRRDARRVQNKWFKPMIF
mmetsp:Transcript_83926/g.238030  ORF Transcript_83926/g.238030 Transcript_83926/m.238030 type:complete len:235 (-) Transcript_83926:101-805(-)